jgi:hypothetical protein
MAVKKLDGTVASTLGAMSAAMFGGSPAVADTKGLQGVSGAATNAGIVGPTAPDKDNPPLSTPLPEKPIAPDKKNPPRVTPSPAPAPQYQVPPANENDSVESRVGGLISRDSDLMKIARQDGMESANKRGLLNSSIAAGAAQREVIRAATPIATADAQAALQKNLQREGQAASLNQLQLQLSASDRQQDKQLASEMARLTYSTEQEMVRLQESLKSADAQQAREIQAQMDRLRESTAAEMQRLVTAAGFDMARLQEQGRIDVGRDAAQAKNAQELAKVQGQIQSALQSQGNTEQIQRMGIDLANQLAVTDRQLQGDLSKIAASGNEEIRRLVEAANQERVTLQQSLASSDRQAMSQAMVNIFQVEAQMRAALLGNTTIPAGERAAYDRTITQLGDPIRAYVNALFGSTPDPASIPNVQGPTTTPETGGLGQILTDPGTPSTPTTVPGTTTGTTAPTSSGETGQTPGTSPTSGLIGGTLDRLTEEQLDQLGLRGVRRA